jgi:predicted ATPase
MITKVCIDNFRCFQNFELELSPLCLLLGDNGSGKSSFLDAISRVRDLVRGAGVKGLFPMHDLAAWDNRPVQVFAVEMRSGDNQYRYELEIAHDLAAREVRIGRERLAWNSRVVYECRDGQVQLYRGTGPDDAPPYTSFPSNSGQSLIPLLERPGDNEPICRFREAMAKVVLIRLDPAQMDPNSQHESPSLDLDGGNFSSWYRYLVQYHPDVVEMATESLRETIPGFGYLRFGGGEDWKWLEVALDGVPRPIPFRLMSDGQRALIALHTLLKAVRRLGYDLFIDEPDNYISLREMQPWRRELEDLYLDDERQVVLVSHHPEFVSHLAESHGVFFTRLNNGSVRARIGYPVFEGLTAAETMARGWDDEEE